MKTAKARGNVSLLFLFLPIFLTTACVRRAGVSPHHPLPASGPELPRMQYAIQAGAFAQVDNAARLAASLCRLGLDATYLKTSEGLYKVRFGNFTSRESARLRAEALKSEGVIEDFYIVSPEDYAVHKKQAYGSDYLRERLAETAQDFVGHPYVWGGASADTGFDCSGLAMAVYQINGLSLPRHSREQYVAGSPVKREDLKKGDLVFFRFSGGGKISHVGIYVGNDKFIHAPGKGKKVCCDSLSQPFFQQSYRGARSYV